MVLCVPCITEDRIKDNLMPEFCMKKSSKKWEILILPATDTWEALQSAQRKGNDSHTTGVGNKDNISFLADLPTYFPMETIAVPEVVFVYEGGSQK